MTQHDTMSNHTGSITRVVKDVESHEGKNARKKTRIKISVEDHDEDHALQKASKLEDAVRSVLEDY